MSEITIHRQEDDTKGRLIAIVVGKPREGSVVISDVHQALAEFAES